MISIPIHRDLMAFLSLLNCKVVGCVYEGCRKLSNKSYGDDLPQNLRLKKIMIEVGRSTTSTLLGKNEVTYESLYISESQNEKLDIEIPSELVLKPQQLHLF